MAQSVEHHLGKVEVPGSNPGNSSKRGVAQLVARMVRDHEAASSSLATSTKAKTAYVRFLLCMKKQTIPMIPYRYYFNNRNRRNRTVKNVTEIKDIQRSRKEITKKKN